MRGCLVFFYVGTESALSLQGGLVGRWLDGLLQCCFFLNEEEDMIIYNSLLAKTFLNRKKRHYFMIFGCCFTRFKYLEVWEDMELRIHARQYTECFFLALLPALVLSVWLSWWWMLLAFMSYHLLYWLERWFGHHSSFDWEALEHCSDALYLRKRKSRAWMKWYGKKSLPPSEWEDD